MYNDVVKAALPRGILLVLFPIVNFFAWLGQGYFWRRGSGYLMARFHERIQHIPLIDFEKATTFDRMKKAQIGSEDAPSASCSVIQFIFYFIPYLVFTSIFLYSVKPILLIALLFIFASVMLAQVLRAGMIRRFMEQNVGLCRQTEYLESCITGKEYIKETRTLGAVEYFFGLFIDSMKLFNKASMETERKVALVELLLRFVNVLGYVGTLALLIYYLVDGSISVGAFASVFYSIDRINALLKGMVDYFGELLKEMGTASFTHEFLVVPPDKGKVEPLEKSVDIYLDNVSFAYPDGKSKVLDNINDYAAGSRFAGISSVFQNFIRYKLTANENITISDIHAAHTVDRVAHEAGVNLALLPNGSDTMLSREFDGTELSGGQW